MTNFDYSKLPGLGDIYLEDSYVLEIDEKPHSLTFRLDAVLTPENPRYREPKPGEQYCYATGTLRFDDVERIEWVSRSDRKYRDATGEEDLGNIDFLATGNRTYHLGGDWGEVRVFTRVQPAFVFDETS